jgi:hypothetical protein
MINLLISFISGILGGAAFNFVYKKVDKSTRNKTGDLTNSTFVGGNYERKE